MTQVGPSKLFYLGMGKVQKGNWSYGIWWQLSKGTTSTLVPEFYSSQGFGINELLLCNK